MTQITISSVPYFQAHTLFDWSWVRVLTYCSSILEFQNSLRSSIWHFLTFYDLCSSLWTWSPLHYVCLKSMIIRQLLGLDFLLNHKNKKKSYFYFLSYVLKLAKCIPCRDIKHSLTHKVLAHKPNELNPTHFLNKLESEPRLGLLLC